MPKAFSLWWEDVERWSVSYLARMHTGVSNIYSSKYQITKLGDVAKVLYGIQKSPSNRPGKNARPYLRVANVQGGLLDLSEIKYIEVADSELETYRLQRGDLLVCEGNSADLVGRPAVWNDEIPNCVHQNHVLKVRLKQDKALPEYVLEFMMTLPIRSYFRANAKFTTNLASINSTDLREMPLVLPPLETQRDIVRQVQGVRSEAARLRAEAAKLRRDTKEEVERLILGTESVFGLV